MYVTFNALGAYLNKQRTHSFDFNIGIVRGESPSFFEKEQIQPKQGPGWYIEKNKLKQY